MLHYFLSVSWNVNLLSQNHRTTESQNGWGWKGHLEIIFSNLPSQAGSPIEGCSGPRSGNFWYLQGWTLHNLPGQFVPVLSHPHSKNVSWCAEGTSCVSLCLVLSLGMTGKSLARSSLHPPFRFLRTLIKSFLILFSRLNSPSSLSLSSYQRCSSPFVLFLDFHWTLCSISMSLLYWWDQNRTQHSSCGLTRAE